MNFLGCDGYWIIQTDQTTICEGDLKTYTAQEMRDFLSPSIPMPEKSLITGGLLTLFVGVYVFKKVRAAI